VHGTNIAPKELQAIEERFQVRMIVQRAPASVPVPLPRASAIVDKVVHHVLQAQRDGRRSGRRVVRLHAVGKLATNGAMSVVAAKVHHTVDVEPMSTPRKTQTVVRTHHIRANGTFFGIRLHVFRFPDTIGFSVDDV